MKWHFIHKMRSMFQNIGTDDYRDRDVINWKLTPKTETNIVEVFYVAYHITWMYSTVWLAALIFRIPLDSSNSRL